MTFSLSCLARTKNKHVHTQLVGVGTLLLLLLLLLLLQRSICTLDSPSTMTGSGIPWRIKHCRYIFASRSNWSTRSLSIISLSRFLLRYAFAAARFFSNTCCLSRTKSAGLIFFFDTLVGDVSMDGGKATDDDDDDDDDDDEVLVLIFNVVLSAGFFFWTGGCCCCCCGCSSCCLITTTLSFFIVPPPRTTISELRLANMSIFPRARIAAAAAAERGDATMVAGWFMLDRAWTGLCLFFVWRCGLVVESKVWITDASSVDRLFVVLLWDIICCVRWRKKKARARVALVYTDERCSSFEGEETCIFFI